MEKMKSMQLRLPHVWHEILTFAANKKKQTLSQFLRDALDKEVKKELKKIEEEARELKENIYDPRITNFK